MLETETSDVDETGEPAMPLVNQDARAPSLSLDVRRRIEHLRELKRLRELLDDPDFDELS